MKYTLTKDGQTKHQKNDYFLEALKAEGWKIEGEDKKPDTLDRECLKKQADDLGIEYAKNIKNEKLCQLIWDKKAK